MILYHYPETQTQEFLAQYRGLHWSKNQQHFEQFTQGQTGYPIIDAAMRELLKTGYMHNRSRMIVASFMTKDLLLDWRWGEEHFAQYLMDYELASNVGGWQWAASVGTDAQPYFRIFNPVLQGQRFDPEGDYIRRFVPELAHLDRHDIHEPWKKAKPAGYPAPIVDHAAMRALALQLYKSAGSRS
jgi:deoxyribodipyrimidine photo-lyase